MNGYDLFMVPFERGTVGGLRRQIMPAASGRVLEVGFGTGANVPYLDLQKITGYTVLDCTIDGQVPGVVDERIEGDVQALPFEAEQFDTVIASLVFCSVADPQKGLDEIHRVLKPGGSYLFIEHVLPEKSVFAPVFRGVTPLWKQMASGCHLDRTTGRSIADRFGAVHFFKGEGVFIGGVARKVRKERK